LPKEEVKFLAKKKRRRSVSSGAPTPRKKKAKWSKWVWLFIVGQIVGYIAIFTIFDSRQEPAPKNNGIYITAAHLSEKEVGTNYKLLYADRATDTAYYLDTNYKAPEQALQEVKIKGIAGAQIVDSKPGKFTVSVSDPQQIVGGLSGERVYDVTGNKVLGFISAMLPGGKLACVAVD
jgi:hypothetical protein